MSRRGRALVVVALASALVAACGRAPAQSESARGEPVQSEAERHETAGYGHAPVEPLALQDFDFGGDFELPSHTGRPFRLAAERGKVVLLFFGYTYCPDICPTTLGTMAEVEKILGADRARVQTVFVSVDPERDSLERLAEYVRHFEAHAVAATGTKAQVDTVVAQFAAFYEKQASASEAGYLVDHTSRLYLIDPRGKVRYLFRYGEDAETIAKGVRLALDR
jgi:protein SCO1/2